MGNRGIRWTSKLLFCAAAISLAAGAAYAQNVPSSVNPGVVERRFQEAPAPLESLDLGLPVPGQQKELSQAEQDRLSKVKFTLKSVNIEGNTAFSDEELSFAYADLIGKRISLLDAQTVARKITDFYQKKGYVLSQAVVPQQSINDGVLKIQVIEGFVSNVVIDGEVQTEYERGVIQGYADNILRMKPVRTQDLERNLLLINDLPGVTVKGLLRPASTFGAAELVVTILDKPFEAAASVDNRGTKFIGPWQYSVMGAANSLLGMYERTQLRLSTASPTTELRSFELLQEHVIGNQGTKVQLLASRTHTEPGDSLKNVQIVGESDLLQARVTHPFIRSRQENLVGRASFDYFESDTDVFNNVDFTEDRLRVLRGGGSYNFFDGWRGNNFFDFQVSQGLDIFNPSSAGTDRTNVNGESDFTKFNLDVTRLQPLPYNFSIFTAASGQYSFDPLLVSEQFSLGGANFGTAYDPAELLGDQGAAGKIELRYSDSLDYKYFNYYQLFTYYDIGRTWIRKGGAGANDKRSLSSIGMGVRANFTDYVSTTLEVGLPLTRPASNQGDHGDDPRVFFGATARF